MPRKSRKELLRLGKRGQFVRVVEGTHRGVPAFLVEYKNAQGRRSARDFPRTRAGLTAAKEFAQGVHEEQSKPPAPPVPRRLEVRELWARFWESESPAFRPNTVRIYRDAWRVWETFVGPHTTAEDLGADSMASLRAELDRREWKVNTIRMTFGVVRHVYNWALAREVIQKNRVGLYVYRVAKDKRPVSPGEFRLDDFDALLGVTPIDDGRYWRAHCALGVCGYQGARQWAVLHLQVSDLDFATDTITWRREWDKMGNEWEQPMRGPTRALLEVALDWRERLGYAGPWVFFAGTKLNQGPIYTPQSLWCALVAAERRAGIPHQPGRGAHGLRRLLAGQMHELTGSVKDAMDAIGDKDIEQAMRYLKYRDDRMRRLFGQLDARHTSASPNGGRGPVEGAGNLQADPADHGQEGV